LPYFPVAKSDRVTLCKRAGQPFTGIMIVIGIGFWLFRRTYQHGGSP